MGVIYSNLKAAWHLNKIAELRADMLPVPAQVQLIISDLCNQDCHFCAYRSSSGFSIEQFGIDGNMNPNRRIPTEKCLEILDDCADMGVQSIQFTGGGEPTVHKDHIRIFEHAQALGMKTGLVTNGVNLKDHPVYDNFDWIRVSVDAGNEETYKQTRNHSGFKRVIKNLKRLGRTAKGVLGVGFVVTEQNYAEIVKATKLAKEAGAAYIRLSAVFSTEGSNLYKGIYQNIKTQINTAKREETKNFSVYDLFGNRISDLDQGAPDYSFCGYQYFNVYIGGDQKVYRCCTTAYTKHGEVGDLTQKSFADWMNEGRGEFDAKTCNVCQFNEKNEVINYLVDKPEHVEFV